MRSCPVVLLLLIGSALGADTAPREIAAARTHYNAAVAAATKPIRDRYLMELESIKRRAMGAKNLELAVAADEEIKALGGTSSSPAAANGAETASFQKRLTNTTWSWVHPGSTITLLPDGKAVVSASTDSYLWEVTNAGKKTAAVKFSGRTAEFTFADDLLSAKATMDGERTWDSKPVTK
jgi:hypothetical protein